MYMKKILLYVLMITFICVGFLGIFVFIGSQELVGAIPTIVSIVIVIHAYKKISVINKNPKSRQEIKEEELRRKAEEKVTLCDIPHQTGLPLAQGAECTVKYDNDKFIIKGGGSTFNLPISKITDITVKTDIEIQKSQVSSIGGAVGGAVLFGPLGAMVGGRVKEKKACTYTYYFIVTYLKDNKIEYVSFDVTKLSHKAENLALEIKENLPNNEHAIEL